MPKVYGKGQISGFLGDPDNMLDLVSNHAATTYWKTFLVNIFRCLLMLLSLLSFTLADTHRHGCECNFGSHGKACRKAGRKCLSDCFFSGKSDNKGKPLTGPNIVEYYGGLLSAGFGHCV